MLDKEKIEYKLNELKQLNIDNNILLYIDKIYRYLEIYNIFFSVCGC
jgi:hypothetical protein